MVYSFEGKELAAWPTLPENKKPKGNKQMKTKVIALMASLTLAFAGVGFAAPGSGNKGGCNKGCSAENAGRNQDQNRAQSKQGNGQGKRQGDQLKDGQRKGPQDGSGKEQGGGLRDGSGPCNQN